MPRIGRAKIRHHISAVSLPKLDAQQYSPADAMISKELTVVPQSAPILVEQERPKVKKGIILPSQPADTISGKAPHPYFVPSKSHLRRQKRKARSLAGGLGSLESALEGVLPAEDFKPAQVVGIKEEKRVKTKEERDEERRVRLEKEKEKGKIGGGKGKTLGEKKRKKIVQESSRRIPAVMKHPAFQQNPWAAIREHVGNTIAQKDPLEREK
ncbi:hypothetical protein I308_104262 [Cryptococcus tetragattii IND107]|uniref:Ribosome biogenesis protein SLX9 n=1 Tax=Cryptococcus tetragattii IND107 TaxID=1296105 RepID=A0ABR3BT74_9TREE